MKKRLLILAGLVVIVAAVMMTMAERVRLQPRVDGRLLSDWITDIVMRRDAQRARLALQDLSTNHVPLLVQWAVETEPVKPSFRSRCIDQYNQEIRWLHARGMTNLHFIRRSKYGPDLDHQTLARYGLPELAPAGKAEAVRELIPMLSGTNEDVAASACFVLSKLTPESIGPLVAVMKNGDEDAREIAATAIGMMGTNGAPAILALKSMLSDPRLSLRMQAANTLGEVGAEPPGFVPTLLQAFADMKDPGTLYTNINEAMQQYARATGQNFPPESPAMKQSPNRIAATNATNSLIR